MNRLKTPRGQLAGLWAAAAIAALASLPAWERMLGGIPPCSFRRMADVPCLTCGSSRALTAMTRGEWSQGFLANPLAFAGTVLFLGGGVLAGLWAMGWIRGPGRAVRGTRWWLAAGLMLVVANWAYLALTYPR